MIGGCRQFRKMLSDMEHLASHGYVVIGVGHTRLSLRVISSQGQMIAIDPGRQREAFTEGASLDY
jgi:hypothetical protein